MRITDINAEYLRPLLPARPENSHKGDYGRVLVIAGSRGMAGAAALAARAALKSGAGLVTVACLDAERSVIACAVPEAMTLPLPSKGGSAARSAADTVLTFQKEKKYDVCLIGPGLSLAGEAPEFARAVIKGLDMPVVVDADALNAMSQSGGRSSPRKKPLRIFTPHEGEAGRFFKTTMPDRAAAIKKLHGLLGGVCILKGPGTLITDGRRLLRNTSGGSALAKGGSGDVLAGLIAGLWAQSGRRGGFTGATALESAALGVHLHGLCGDLAAARLTARCVLAGELLQYLPAAFRRVQK